MSMPRLNTDTPAAVLQTLNNDGAVLPPRTTCDVFSRTDAKVRCMVCNAPAMKGNEALVVVVLMGASRHDQREAATALQRLLGDGSDAAVGLRWLQAGGVTLMLAPWSAREMVRGVAQSVAAGWHPQRVTVDGARLDNDGVVVVPGPGSQGDLAVEIRQTLEHFAADTGSLWEQARRFFSGRQEPKRWELPMGCSVVERLEGRQVCWDIGFEDMRKLERAVELVEARLALRKDPLLHYGSSASDEDAVETRMPSIQLSAPAHSREARAQLARLLRNVLFLIGRLGFATSRPADLRDSIGQPG